jgi:sulfite reductase alpha subunit-like flavoprotein
MELLILYASETGNSQDAANTIASRARRRRINVRCYSIDTYAFVSYVDYMGPLITNPYIMNCQEQFPQEKCVIFVCSTTGDGDIPLPMRKFWKVLLRKDLPKTLLESLNYTVFGLGDSAYEKYVSCL